MLGIIGGMGPAASALFYEMVTEKTGAASDQENLNLVLLSHASMPDRTAAILSGNIDKINEVRELLLADALSLANQGCDALAVTCNTAHYFVDMIKGEVPVPFIHLIESTAEAVAKHFGVVNEEGEEACHEGNKRPEEESDKAGTEGPKVAILATDGTIKTGLYQKALAAKGARPYEPDGEIQSKVMSQIYDRIKAGLPAEEEEWRAIEDAIKQAGCNGAVLGCTELSIISKQLGLAEGRGEGLVYFDPMEVMAERCIDFFRARGEIK